MKTVFKTICVLLSGSMLFLFAGCAKKPAKQSPGGSLEIAFDIYEGLKTVYTGRTLVSCLEAAALYRAGFHLENCDWRRLVEKPAANMESQGQYLIAAYFLQAAGCDLTGYETAEHVAYLEESIKETESLSTAGLGLCILALSLYESDFDKAAAAEALLSRQNEINGAFYDFPPVGGEKTAENPVAAAFALLSYQSIKPFVQSAKYNDAINDGAMLYLFHSIDENNTVRDKNGKKSALATALCLSSFICAGMTPEGDNAFCLLSALKAFSVGEGGGFSGYAEYETDEKASAEATAGVLFAAVATLYGNPFSPPGASVPVR